MEPNLIIILPAHNEEATIQNVVLELITWLCLEEYDFNIVLVDDRSEDSTFKKMCSFDKCLVVRNNLDGGKGSALKYGVIVADMKIESSRDDVVVFLDADGQINPREIKTFINHMELNSADAVIGNKRHTFSTTKYSFTRKIVSLTYNALVRKLFDFDYRDTQCGIKIFRKSALDRIMPKVNVKKFAFDIELIVAMRCAGLRVADAPVTLRGQTNAGSVSLWTIANTLYDTLTVWVRMKRGYYDKEI